jgi:hypothetical protein
MEKNYPFFAKSASGETSCAEAGQNEKGTPTMEA